MFRRNQGRAWTEEETARLKEHIERGGSATRAAIMFKRSEQAVRTHAKERLGLRFPTIRQLRKKATGTESFSGS